ncbi:16S rRNA (uracil(1498)-N(3))-methyltransferase [Lentibacillus kimchii]|uniref:Ribosomal RNA small subunit methyltransferase E n=1 Tax=Lentibacillus kimchii TaxID=1542911 RepID=A0ABW2UZS8_9BACI
MQRYFVPAENWNDNEIVITGDDAHHIIRVMRSKTGETIICSHPNGQAATSTITSITNNVVHAVVKEWLEGSAESPVEVTIAQGLPKNDKMETVLQKGTELGAASFIPVRSERTVVVWDDKKMDKKMRRFNKIVKEASEQSQRNKMPSIQPISDLKKLAEVNAGYHLKLFAYEEEAKKETQQLFSSYIKNVRPGERVLIVIGPEGGFSEKEADLLKQNAFYPVRLGPRILRTETAALYALASISYQFEESAYY